MQNKKGDWQRKSRLFGHLPPQPTLLIMNCSFSWLYLSWLLKESLWPQGNRLAKAKFPAFKGKVPSFQGTPTSDWCCRESSTERNDILDLAWAGQVILWIKWQNCLLIGFKKCPVWLAGAKTPVRVGLECHLFWIGSFFVYGIWVFFSQIIGIA